MFNDRVGWFVKGFSTAAVFLSNSRRHNGAGKINNRKLERLIV